MKESLEELLEISLEESIEDYLIQFLKGFVHKASQENPGGFFREQLANEIFDASFERIVGTTGEIPIKMRNSWKNDKEYSIICRNY